LLRVRQSGDAQFREGNHFHQRPVRSGLSDSQFILTPVPGLPGVFAGSLAWGDYDNDCRLDFLLSGSFTLSLWRNTGNGFSNVTANVAQGLPGLYDSAVAWLGASGRVRRLSDF
jgi:hypothetical protein